MMNASAYIQQNRLCILGVYASSWGPIPFSHAIACEAPDGPVNFSSELTDTVDAAVKKSQRDIMAKVKIDEMRMQAENLVERARAGDQNAMGLLVMIRKNAAAGNERAKLSMQLCMEYIKQHKHSPFGFEAEPLRESTSLVAQSLGEEILNPDPLHYTSAILTMTLAMDMDKAAVTLANGPGLDERIEKLAESLDENQRMNFMNGIQHWQRAMKAVPDSNSGIESSRSLKAYELGRRVGLARTIQYVRLPNTPISALSPLVGWELGE